MLTQIGENMKKQLLLVSALIGMTTASFASDHEGGMGSKLQTYNSIPSIGEALLKLKPATTFPKSGPFEAFATKIGVSAEDGKKALYGALVGESDVKAELSAEMAEGFDQEKEKAGNALVKMFVDSMNARKVSAIGKLNTLLEKYVGEEIIDPNTDLSKIEISALVDGKIEAVLNGIDVAIDAQYLQDFKNGLSDVLASVKADLIAAQSFDVKSITDIFASYDTASRDLLANKEAELQSRFEEEVTIEVKKRSTAGMSKSELKSRLDEEFESEEEIKQPIKFTSNKVEQTKEEVSVPTKHTKPEHTQPAKEEEKKAYNLANLSEFKVIDSKKSGMPRANYLKGKDSLKAEYDAWVKDGKPQS